MAVPSEAWASTPVSETLLIESPKEAPRAQRPPSSLLRYGALLVLIIQNSALALAMRYSRTASDDTYITR
jgi:hypothetical protein